jgi:hypothetical protein
MNVSVQTIDKLNVRTEQPSSLIGNMVGAGACDFSCKMEVRRRRKRGGGGGVIIRQGRQVMIPSPGSFAFEMRF